jgi:hypothetical protein
MFTIVFKINSFNYKVLIFQIFCLSINCKLIIIFYARENLFTLTINKLLTYDLRRIHELETISISNSLLNTFFSLKNFYRDRNRDTVL